MHHICQEQRAVHWIGDDYGTLTREYTTEYGAGFGQPCPSMSKHHVPMSNQDGSLVADETDHQPKVIYNRRRIVLKISVTFVCSRCGNEYTRHDVEKRAVPLTGYADARLPVTVPPGWQLVNDRDAREDIVCKWCLAETADLPCRLESEQKSDQDPLYARLAAYA